MKAVQSSIIYENPLPQLRSRHSFFPFLGETKDGRLFAVYAIGQAFESVDSHSCISFSEDGGKTWTEPVAMFDKTDFDHEITDYCKVTVLPDGRLMALGYAYHRENEDLPIGNPETGGLLDDFLFCAFSEDEGRTWGKLQPIECAWGPHAEASAPVTVLNDGSLITPITGFPDWEGKLTGKLCGRALRSEDGGVTWNDESICMDFGTDAITCYEQRMCQLSSGTVVCIGWNENTDTGERLPNHFTYSQDNGKTWSEPVSTGILGQASCVCALEGEKLLALHAVRRDTDRPGIYGCIVDFSQKTWNIVEQELLWEPAVPVTKDTKMAEIFSFLKFGQPGAILLRDGDILMSHWYAQEGQYKTVATRIQR